MARLLVRTALANLRSRPLQTALVAPHPRGRVGDAGARGEPARGCGGSLREDRARHQRGRRPRRRARATSRRWRTRPACKAADGPFRLLGVRVRSRPTNYNLALEGVGARPPRIDRPKLTDGRWLSGAPGELVLDRPTARDRGVHVGQRLTVLLHDRRTALTVVGIAVSAGRDRSWVSERTLAALPPGGDPIGRVLELQLADRNASGAFVDDVRRRYAPDQLNAYDWRRRSPGGHRPDLDVVGRARQREPRRPARGRLHHRQRHRRADPRLAPRHRPAQGGGLHAGRRHGPVRGREPRGGGRGEHRRHRRRDRAQPAPAAADRQPAGHRHARAGCARSRWRRASSGSSPWCACSRRCRPGARGGSACSRRSPWGARA